MQGEFYKMEYEAWDTGTYMLSVDEIGAYLLFCHQMYRTRSDVPDNINLLARLWKCHPNRARKLLGSLVDAGKIQHTQDGHLTNTRVRQELDAAETRRTQRSVAAKTSGTHSGVVRRNSLKSNDATEANAHRATNEIELEKRREEESRGEKRIETEYLEPLPDGEGRKQPAADDGEEPVKPKRDLRGTRVPSDWKLGHDQLEAAIKAGMNERVAERETEKFVDYWKSQPGAKGVKLDWPATWRNWCKNWADRNTPIPGQRPAYGVGTGIGGMKVAV